MKIAEKKTFSKQKLQNWQNLYQNQSLFPFSLEWSVDLIFECLRAEVEEEEGWQRAKLKTIATFTWPHFRIGWFGQIGKRRTTWSIEGDKGTTCHLRRLKAKTQSRGFEMRTESSKFFGPLPFFGPSPMVNNSNQTLQLLTEDRLPPFDWLASISNNP